jgi:DNA-binding response OmpR family regulator
VPEKKVKATLLCVDDDSQCLAVRRLMLEAHGFNVITSINPKQGLKLFRSKRFDAAVLDYHMPGMNGAELAKAMKDVHSDVPVLILSGLLELPETDPVYYDSFVCKSEAGHKLIREIQSLIKTRNGDGGNGVHVPLHRRFVAFGALALGFAVEGVFGRRHRSQRPKVESMQLKALTARA